MLSDHTSYMDSLQKKLNVLTIQMSDFKKYYQELLEKYGNKRYTISFWSGTDVLLKDYHKFNSNIEIESDIDMAMTKISEKRTELDAMVKDMVLRKHLDDRIRGLREKLKTKGFKHVEMPEGVVVAEIEYYKDLAPSEDIVVGNTDESDCDWKGYMFKIRLVSEKYKSRSFFEVEVQLDYTDSYGSYDYREGYHYMDAKTVDRLNGLKDYSIDYRHPRILTLCTEKDTGLDPYRIDNLPQYKLCSESVNKPKPLTTLQKEQLSELLEFTKLVLKTVCDTYPNQYQWENQFNTTFAWSNIEGLSILSHIYF